MDECLRNVHDFLPLPQGAANGKAALVKGSYLYCHYAMDDFQDQGWGCGYRTLQTLCSWVSNELRGNFERPSLLDIQKTLVRIGDKEPAFIGSKDWIGSIEVALVVDTLYDVPCKILHIQTGSHIPTFSDQLFDHFSSKGSPVMMGGSSDSASKAILGVCLDSSSQLHLLILDPHYSGPVPNQQTLADCDMLLWRPASYFESHSFYNLCLPQLSSKS